MHKLQSIKKIREVSPLQVEKANEQIIIKSSSLQDTFNINNYLNYAVFRYLPYELRRKVLRDSNKSKIFDLQDLQNVYDLAKYDIADEIQDNLHQKHKKEIDLIRKQYEQTISQIIKEQQPNHYSDIFI
ncbi:hypothetical protein SS50377_22118 [Spironucleus salmonicida]|uniref:Uncharacterized protein n=1 Tax=Spironucleus salmonicida TaxID=348837 RepID=V6LM09_9EUKA|nr:hypothetical protein SS50377_22118 [Spironucleus salmonicida]|eukprot:EST45722.1 Hypothetical protein SS50377_14293 [Spironucleus salmonicida]